MATNDNQELSSDLRKVTASNFGSTQSGKSYGSEGAGRKLDFLGLEVLSRPSAGARVTPRAVLLDAPHERATARILDVPEPLAPVAVIADSPATCAKLSGVVADGDCSRESQAARVPTS